MAKYRRKAIAVDAVKITSSMKVNTEEGLVDGNQGDYLITEENGKQYPITAELFEKTYEPIKLGFDAKKLVKVAYRVVKYKLIGSSRKK